MAEKKLNQKQMSDCILCTDIFLQITQRLCDEHEPIVVLQGIASAYWEAVLYLSNPSDIIANQRTAQELMEFCCNVAKEQALASVANDAETRGSFGNT